MSRDPPVLAAMLQRPAVPGRRLRDRELRVLGCHQRGRRGAGQRVHRGGTARAAGGLGQHLAAELPGLGPQGGHAPAASGLRPRQARTGPAWNVLLPAGERLIRSIPRPQGECRHRPLPGPRQFLGLSGHRVHPRKGKPEVQTRGWCMSLRGRAILGRAPGHRRLRFYRCVAL